MDFGRVGANELNTINFSLPKDPEGNKAILLDGRETCHFYLGAPVFAFKDWVGDFYPPGTRDGDYLKQYGRQCNALEFNGFFYGVPSYDTIKKWTGAVPDGFLFCTKLTETITHSKRLRDVQQDLQYFTDGIRLFGKKMGPVFLMPHPGMDKSDFRVIANFIEQFPTDIGLFVELRHQAWYKDAGGYDEAMLNVLRNAGAGTIITDTAGRRDMVHMHLTTNKCFIRFTGNSLQPTDYSRIDSWVTRLGEWMQMGLEQCYFFIHQPDERHVPVLMRYFAQQMNQHNGTNIKVPASYVTPTLF